MARRSGGSPAAAAEGFAAVCSCLYAHSPATSAVQVLARTRHALLQLCCCTCRLTCGPDLPHWPCRWRTGGQRRRPPPTSGTAPPSTPLRPPRRRSTPCCPEAARGRPVVASAAHWRARPRRLRQQQQQQRSILLFAPSDLSPPLSSVTLPGEQQVRKRLGVAGTAACDGSVWGRAWP